MSGRSGRNVRRNEQFAISVVGEGVFSGIRESGSDNPVGIHRIFAKFPFQVREFHRYIHYVFRENARELRENHGNLEALVVAEPQFMIRFAILSGFWLDTVRYFQNVLVLVVAKKFVPLTEESFHGQRSVFDGLRVHGYYPVHVFLRGSIHLGIPGGIVSDNRYSVRSHGHGYDYLIPLARIKSFRPRDFWKISGISGNGKRCVQSLCVAISVSYACRYAYGKGCGKGNLGKFHGVS